MKQYKGITITIKKQGNKLSSSYKIHHNSYGMILSILESREKTERILLENAQIMIDTLL